MILSRPTAIREAEQKKRNQRRIAELMLGVRRFALTPVQMADGQWIWFQPYWTFFSGGQYPNGELFLETYNKDGGLYLTDKPNMYTCRSFRHIDNSQDNVCLANVNFFFQSRSAFITRLIEKAYRYDE